MPALPLTTTWLKIASAGQAVEIQNISAAPILITTSPAVPVANDGVLLSALDGREFALTADLYGRAAGAGPAIIEVMGGFALPSSGAVPFATALPVIGGIAQLGQTLTASHGVWTGAPTSYADQWLRGGVPVAGATSASYLVGPADFGAVLAVTVTATNGAGSATATSLVTLPVSGTQSGGGAFNTADFTDPNNAFLVALAA